MSVAVVRLTCPECEVEWSGPAHDVCWCCGKRGQRPLGLAGIAAAYPSAALAAALARTATMRDERAAS